MKRLFALFVFYIFGFLCFAQSSHISISVSPMTFITISQLPLVTEENGESEIVPFCSLSFNYGNDFTEHDFFISIYPNEYSFGYERRIFFNEDYNGFFYGGFISLDYRRFSIEDKSVILDLTQQLTNNFFSTFGIRIGPEIGVRIKRKSNNLGLTPKLGLGIPLYFTSNLSKKNKDFNYYYFQSLKLSAFFIGLKFDFFAQDKL